MPITDIDWPQWQKLNSYYNMNTGLLELGSDVSGVWYSDLHCIVLFEDTSAFSMGTLKTCKLISTKMSTNSAQMSTNSTKMSTNSAKK